METQINPTTQQRPSNSSNKAPAKTISYFAERVYQRQIDDTLTGYHDELTPREIEIMVHDLPKLLPFVAHLIRLTYHEASPEAIGPFDRGCAIEMGITMPRKFDKDEIWRRIVKANTPIAVKTWLVICDRYLEQLRDRAHRNISSNCAIAHRRKDWLHD